MKAIVQGRLQRWLLLAIVLTAQLPIVIDMTILHVAVPTLTLALQASGSEVLWIIDIYPLLLAGLLVPMGTLADKLGVRHMFLTGLTIFLIASLIAAYAPSAVALILARSLMGIGAAMAIPCVLAVIRHTFTDAKERALALGMWSTVSAAGAAIGPLIGGILLEHFWWGSVFLINVIIILVLWPLAFYLLPKSSIAQQSEWHLSQSLLLIVGLMTTVYGLKSIFKTDNNMMIDGAVLVTGLIIILVFIKIQSISSRPMLDLSLFSKPAIRAGLVSAFIVAGALVGIELTIALELQFVLGLTPLEAGLFMMPLMIAAAVGGPLAGLIVVKTGLRKLVISSLTIAGISVAGLSLSSFHNPDLYVYALLVLLGLTLSIGLTASSIAVMGSSSPEKAAACGALEMTGYDMGAGLGITVVGVILAKIYQSEIILPEGLTQGLADQAQNSISDTMVVASQISGPIAEALAQAGRNAFVSAHSTVLMGAGIIMLLLAAITSFLLRDFRDSDISGH